MSLFYYKMLAALLIFLLTIAGAAIVYPFMRRHSPDKHIEPLALADALASGIFLGAAFFHMLPDAIRLFNENYAHIHYPVPELVCVAGFLFLLFLERLSLTFGHIQARISIPYILALILIIHALIEGLALGIRPNLPETVLLFIAIMAHKGSESFALGVTLIKHALSIEKLLFILLFFSLMTPLGILLGTMINHSTMAKSDQWIEALFNAFAAGTFLYISTLHHIHFHDHADDPRGLVEFASLVLGAATMAVIAIWT